MKNPLAYRHPELVAAILATVDDVHPGRIAWTDLLDAYTHPGHDRKTIDGTLRDMARAGLIERIGHYQPHHDTRAVRITHHGHTTRHDPQQERTAP